MHGRVIIIVHSSCLEQSIPGWDAFLKASSNTFLDNTPSSNEALGIPDNSSSSVSA